MTYLPNSIERCAPIVGYDPYAFIMDKPSNILPPNAAAPALPDSFEAQGQENNCKKSGSKLLKGAKYTALIVTLAAVAMNFRKGTNAIRKLFGKAPKSAPKFIQNTTAFVQNKIYNPAKNAVVNLFNKIVK